MRHLKGNAKLQLVTATAVNAIMWYRELKVMDFMYTSIPWLILYKLV